MKTARCLYALGVTIMVLAVLDFIFGLIRMDPVNLHVLIYGLDTYVMVLFQRIFDGAVLIGIAKLLKNQAWH